MHIKEIELVNFKSFGRKVVIPLENDFVAVTGPNGSGKSNVVDALLFALSLSSSRAMRAERLPDLIYHGDNGKNPDFAQVTVKFDNSSRTIPLDGDVLEIARKVRLTKNKYQSIYYFNGNPCTQTEIHDHLSRAGITPEGYNVVMQGDVTRIIEMTPLERRRIVDEIAGVAEFDEKKKKALEELEVVRERIDRGDVILVEVESQLSRLAEERDRALAYQAHREEKRRMEAFLLLAKLKEAESDLADLEREGLELQDKERLLSESLDQERAAHSVLEGELQELNAEITYKGEDEQIEVKRRMVEAKGRIEADESRIEMAEAEIAEIEAEQRSDYLEADRIGREAEVLAEEIRDGSIRKASILAEVAEREESLQGYRDEIARADARYSGLRDELASVKRDVEETKSRASDLMRERDRHLDAARRRSIEREEAAMEIAEAKETASALQREKERIGGEQEGIEERISDIEEERDDLDSARISIRREMAAVDEKLQRLQMERARAEASLRSAGEGSGYSRAVEAIRSAISRGQLSGLYGTIAELGDVSSVHSTALEVAAGARLQSIVAETDGDAAQAIEGLKRSKAGRATFLPLNKMPMGNPPPPPQEDGVVDYAINLVEFEPRFHPAFWSVFRETLVVKDLNTARRLMGRYRMVTLEGDLVEKGGAMTGGHFKSRLKFAADERQRLEDANRMVVAAQAEREALIERLDRVEGEVSAVRRNAEELGRDLSRIEVRTEEIESQMIRLERLVQDRETRLAEMTADAAGVREKLDSLEGKIREVEAESRGHQERAEELERALSGSEIPEISALADGLEAEIRGLERKSSEIEAEITGHRLRRESCVARKAELAKRKESREEKKRAAAEKKRAAAERVVEAKAALVELARKEREIEEELSGLKGERSRLLDRVAAQGRAVDSIEREVDRVRARMAAAEGAAREIRSSAEGLRAEIEGFGIDVSEDPPKSQTIIRKINALERSMEELEPVNMLAIEEYDRVFDRMETLRERRETLQREREDLLAKLDRYEEMKRETFMAAFNGINENFRDTFHALSDGEGELILENEDDPLSGGMTIRARPARKAFHRLEAMSGGEKSLTALSFIFAIQRFRPAPFYALDEIDMFLDGANVERVAKLIKGIAQTAQFIVVSLRKPMIQEAKYIVGVTMQENNISTVTGVCLN
ncbi:chromosome segregation protein SMC [Methanotrichaceae archaeon M04Ac]|uniref:Chromosome partition protein Smc n=1 Tax=Candidatus Methanocrinis alkalitolerans TaxID=3033395 RepID=A0ABT5XC26_9EURY|nr:chromosome segregation protein SMC [Candidatus Methanocrinis alkalitolerans]MDF0592268.1 chromosome segregation protein SMC [Candidatus Methanocrinis alkalitolerans]